MALALELPLRLSNKEVSLIKFEAVNKWFGDFQVLKDVNLDIERGEVVVIIGPSGSGKSTLLRCINGLDSVTAGKLTVDGVEVSSPKASLNEVRAEIGFIFQQFNLYPHKTVEQNITLAPVKLKRMTPQRGKERATELLTRVGIPEQAGKYPAQLSGGQQQRVAIARGLAMEPKMMLFDEPTSALDPEMIKEVLDVIADLAVAGMTLVIVTHEMNFARRVADRVVFMDFGKIVEIQKPNVFFDRPQNERTREFLSKVLSH